MSNFNNALEAGLPSADPCFQELISFNHWDGSDFLPIHATCIYYSQAERDLYCTDDDPPSLDPEEVRRALNLTQSILD